MHNLLKVLGICGANIYGVFTSWLLYIIFTWLTIESASFLHHCSTLVTIILYGVFGGIMVSIVYFTSVLTIPYVFLCKKTHWTVGVIPSLFICYSIYLSLSNLWTGQIYSDIGWFSALAFSILFLIAYIHFIYVFLTAPHY